MIQFILFSNILVLFLLFSCKPSQNHTTNHNFSNNQQNQHTIEQQINKNLNFEAFMEQLTVFHFKSLKELSSSVRQDNICYCPLSLQMAIGMVYSGAEGQTASEIATVMGFPNNQLEFLEHISNLQNYLEGTNTSDISKQFLIANKIWIEKSFRVLQSYVNVIKKYFQGGFEQVDFINETEKVRLIVNKWVEQQTRGTINNFLPPGFLNEQVVMLLINAIYFKSSWKTQFDPNLSKIDKFYIDLKRTIDQKYMRGTISSARYTKYHEWQILELFYENTNFSFLVFLPHQSTSLNITNFIPSANQYKEAINQLKVKEVIVQIPIFRIETSIQLEDFLQKMGITRAFGPKAEFSGIRKERDIFISKALQKVFFECNEFGSEASAATAIVMVRSSMRTETQPIEFIANRPFIYILKENQYHLPLFVGIYCGEEAN